MTPEQRRATATWGKRIILTVLILGGAVYGVLSMAQRSKEPIRLGLQDYMTQATGHPAEITEMVSARLIPDTAFKMKGVVIRDGADKQKTLLKAAQAYIAIPFWQLMTGAGGYLGFEVRDLEAATGYILPQKLTVTFGGISDPSGGRAMPQFIAEGRYNDRDFLMTAEMDRKDRKKKPPIYRFARMFPVTFKLGEFEARGVTVRDFTQLSLKDVKIARGDEQAAFDVSGIDLDKGSASLAGTINGVPFTGSFVTENSLTTLRIAPGSSGPEDIKKIRDFIAVTREDFGLAGEADPILFDIVSPEEPEKI